MANINANPIRFENGGIIEIAASGGAFDVVLLVEAGTLKVQNGGYEPLIYKDRGALSTSPIEGDQKPAMIEFDVKLAKGGWTGASELLKRLATAGTNGNVAKFDMKISFPDYRGAATGDKLSPVNCILTEQPQYQAGSDFDKVSMKFQVMAAFIPAATY